VCDLETSRMGAPYIYDISRLRVKKENYSISALVIPHASVGATLDTYPCSLNRDDGALLHAFLRRLRTSNTLSVLTYYIKLHLSGSNVFKKTPFSFTLFATTSGNKPL